MLIFCRAFFHLCSSVILDYNFLFCGTCLDDISIDVSEVFKFPTIIVLSSVSLFMAVRYWHIYSGSPILGTYIFTIVISSWIDPLIIMQCPSLSLVTVFILRHFVWYECCYSSFILISMCIEYLLPSSHFQFVCVHRTEMVLL